jgi:hypothetical protein
MGQLLSFCSDPEESEKPKLLSEPQPKQEEASVDDELVEATRSSDAYDKDSERLLREEQARLELIVSTAGRDMVAVRSTRANPGYYDQGFAAALAQHLNEQIGSSSSQKTLPKATVIDIYATLNKSPHVLFDKRENPNTFMDHAAESLLASFVPTKEHIFAGVGPMVENLL